jgi:L-histidine Nalpha-methyltransferase
MNQFLEDVLTGLSSTPKYLQSKYFYDKKGDELFQQLMASDEYYLTNCEMEILSSQTAAIADVLLQNNAKLDVIEFGPGDASKSSFLLNELMSRKALGAYLPIDISKNIITFLEDTLPAKIPGISLNGLNGEYFEMLARAGESSENNKLLLFLGANIGNFRINEARAFCKKLYNHLPENSLLLIGFDLKKNPHKILAAYNDKAGITRQFNLNLLERINRELHADFELNQFEHYATYDPLNGACKSYLISLRDQHVCIENTSVHFKKNEAVFMEISQKYDMELINEISVECGFEPVGRFYDRHQYFADVIWKR